jgi:hypothetical protein
MASMPARQSESGVAQSRRPQATQTGIASAAALARRSASGRAIEPILEQAERVGSEIKRPPYDDYIDGSAKTGIYRVVSYGDAFFVDGELTYHPERRTVLIKPTADIRTLEVLQP